MCYLIFFFTLFMYFPDWGKAPQWKQQLHFLCFYGQQAIRPHLLFGGLLHPSGPHGAGLPEDLHHGSRTRPADQHATAGRRGWGLHSWYLRCKPWSGCNIRVCWPSTQPSYANRNKSSKDSMHHYGMFLPLLGTILCHQCGGPIYRLYSARTVVDRLPVAGLHKLHAQPHSLRLPQQILPPCLPHHPMLREEEVSQAIHHGNRHDLYSHADQRFNTCTQVSSINHFILWLEFCGIRQQSIYIKIDFMCKL